ncbi:MAG: ABC transporter permease [Actinomycetota bacterium]|nr:ABC transporter permease [Actinomycetota bacterium]
MKAGLPRMLRRQVGARPGRAVVLGAGILVAATSFSLLTAAADSSEARVRGVVAANFRTSYDLLVRPPGSQSQLERARGLIRNNFETGIFGGITTGQWRQVQAVPGVEVAAPVAYLGWVNETVGVEVPIGRYMALDSPVRIRALTSSQTGRAVQSHFHAYFVVTKADCNGVYVKSPRPRTAFDADDYGICLTVGGDGLQNSGHVKNVGATSWDLVLSYPLLVAAVDPVAEDRLVGLDRAVVSGRALRPVERVEYAAHGPVLPVLASSRSFRDQTATLTVERLKIPAGPAATRLLVDPHGSGDATQMSSNWPKINATPSVPVGSFSYSADVLYRELRRVWTLPLADYHRSPVYMTWAASPVSYRGNADGSLSAVPLVNDPASTWRKQLSDPGQPFWPTADENADVQFRRLVPQPFRGPNSGDGSPGYLDFRKVGEYDPQRLPGFSELIRVPLETYRAPLVTAGDAASRAVLKGKPLGPTSNLGGYVAQPPFLLTSLSAASAMTAYRWFGTADDKPLPTASAPISVIRVRVAGVTGPDKTSLARLKSVAGLIAARTGLTVDVTAGSSPQAQIIRLPAGRFGSPPLTVREGWTRKGVALLIVAAVDRKSLALFGLILLVTVSFLINASFASVRARRAEIGTLATMGWSAGQVFRLVLGELALIGAAAGLAGAAVSAVLIAVTGLHLSPARVLLIPPVALALALTAGAAPAWGAARISPIAALAPPVHDSRRRAGRRVRSISGYAWSGLARRPGRTVLSAITLGLAVACLAGLLTATFAFRGTVAGSLLGNYVTVQIRGVDYASAALAVALACFSVADLLALTIRERASEIVTLKATGWADRHLTRATLLEAAAVTALGALPGAGITLATATALGAPIGLTAVAAATAVTVGTLLVLAFAAVPARAAGRTPIAAALAED